MSRGTSRRELIGLLSVGAVATACGGEAAGGSPFDGEELPGRSLGPAAPLTLSVPALTAGAMVTASVTGATPGQPVWLGASGVGNAGGACPAFLAGSCIDLQAPVRVLGMAHADATGAAYFTFTVPATLAGMTGWFQAVAATPAGLSASVEVQIADLSTDTGDTALPPTCDVIPSETTGPYPDTIGMVNNPTWYRQDITEGRVGVGLTLNLQVVDVSAGCDPLVGAAVEVWHCDKDGAYSEYAGQPGIPSQVGTTYLRGLQTTNSRGYATFQTIYPGWYPGRVTHIHFRVWVGGQVVKVSQIAFPDTTNVQVNNSSLYVANGQNNTTNSNDNVFRDGTQFQMATLSGSVAAGFVASLTVGVA